MSQDQIIEKIKKLLRMKRGGTAGEIENALRMAQELASKHGIDMASVNPDEESEERRISHAEEILKSRLPMEAKFAAAILVNFFNVGVIIMKRWNMRIVQRFYIVAFIGTAWDCEVAKYVFAFLQQHFRRSWSQRENRRLKNRAAYLSGMYLGLGAKLEADRDKNLPNEAGLILISRGMQRRNDYIKKFWPNSKDHDLQTDDSTAWASKMAGIHAGDKTQIRQGVTATKNPALMLE